MSSCAQSQDPRGSSLLSLSCLWPPPRVRAAAAPRWGWHRGRLPCGSTALRSSGPGRAPELTARCALRSNTWRESVNEARRARRPRPCGARGHSLETPWRLGQIRCIPFFKRNSTLAGHRGRANARGQQPGWVTGLTRTEEVGWLALKQPIVDTHLSRHWSPIVCRGYAFVGFAARTARMQNGSERPQSVGRQRLLSDSPIDRARCAQKLGFATMR